MANSGDGSGSSSVECDDGTIGCRGACIAGMVGSVVVMVTVLMVIAAMRLVAVMAEIEGNSSSGAGHGSCNGVIWALMMVPVLIELVVTVAVAVVMVEVRLVLMY